MAKLWKQLFFVQDFEEKSNKDTKYIAAETLHKH